ncbi:MFS transporter [bacterium]|nr:MFS transporter [bacterium]
MRKLFRNRSFLSIWTASIVSGLGDKIAIIAFFSLIMDRTGSVVNLGLLAAVQIIPGVLLGPVAGVIIDRWRKKRVMILTDVFSATVVFVIPFVESLPVIYFLAALLSIGRQFHSPARLALMPEVVEDNLLKKSNALTMLTQNLVLMFGMALGGIIVESRGVNSAFFADSLTFVFSALILIQRRFIYLEIEKAPKKVQKFWKDLSFGATHLLGNPRLRFAVIFLGTVTMVTAMQPPLVFDFVKNIMMQSEKELGFIFGSAGVGGIVGALIAGAARSKSNPLTLITVLLAIDGVLLGLFAVNRNPALAILLFACFGAISSGLQVNLATFLQRETPEEIRGRVFGWLTPMIGPITLLSVLIGPIIASRVGVVPVLIAAGVGEILFGIVGRIFVPKPAIDS